jgi:glycosyltransferase involved in cell wall biosynthesis
MKLLFVSHRSDVSGGEICLQRIMERLIGHELLVILPEGGFAERLQQAGIPVVIENGLVKMGRGEGGFSLLGLANRFPRVVWRLRGAIRKFGADLVISNALGPLPYAGPAARFAGVPNVCIHHHPVLKGGTNEARVVSILARTCDGFIAVSEAMNRGLQAAGVPATKVTTIYNGLDVDFFSVADAPSGLLRTQLGVSGETRLIGLVGTLSESKGHHVLVEAAQRLRDSVGVKVPWRMVFVGGVFEGSGRGAAYASQVRDQIAAAKLGELVIFAGKQSNMRDVYADLDFVVNASTEPEPFGTTLYEGMARGKPAIASDLGGSSEIVDGGRAGFLVPAGDGRALAELLAKLLGGEIDLAPIVAAGRSRVEQLFDLRDTARKYDAYFRSFARTA